MKKIIFLSSLFLILVNFVNAVPSNLFIDHLSKQIYDDCAGYDINLTEGYVFQGDISVTVIPNQFYNEQSIKQIVKVLGSYEPYNDHSNGCVAPQYGNFVGIEGCGILKCGVHKLDINKYDYFWDEVKVDVPREEFNTYNGNYAETHGDNSPAVSGENNTVSVNNKSLWVNLFWSQGTIGGAILMLLLGAIFWVLKRVAYDKWKEKRGKKKR